jgi:hypothetical protein
MWQSMDECQLPATRIQHCQFIVPIQVTHHPHHKSKHEWYSLIVFMASWAAIVIPKTADKLHLANATEMTHMF